MYQIYYLPPILLLHHSLLFSIPRFILPFLPIPTNFWVFSIHCITPLSANSISKIFAIFAISYKYLPFYFWAMSNRAAYYVLSWSMFSFLLFPCWALIWEWEAGVDILHFILMSKFKGILASLKPLDIVKRIDTKYWEVE